MGPDSDGWEWSTKESHYAEVFVQEGEWLNLRLEEKAEEPDCRKAWQSTPVFLPGESHEQRSLEGYSPWGYKELDMTERLN